MAGVNALDTPDHVAFRYSPQLAVLPPRSARGSRTPAVPPARRSTSLPGNHRLDATLPVRPRLAGFSATLHDKGPIGRDRGGNGDSVISWPSTCPRGISELSSCGNIGYSM